MKLLFTVGFILIYSTLSAQGDSIPTIEKNALPKNQISLFLNLGMVNSDGPFYSIDYLRLNRISLHKNTLNLRHCYFSLDLSPFSSWNIRFDKHEFMQSSDSSVSLRSFGNEARDFNLKVGFQEQTRVLFDKETYNGLQFHVSLYGILGYTKQLDQYLYTQQVPGSIQDGNLIKPYGENVSITGERLSHYLRLGLGSSFGFEWVGNINKLWLSLGLNLNLLNIGVDYLANSKTIIDPDVFYTRNPSKIKLHSDFGIGTHASIAF